MPVYLVFAAHRKCAWDRQAAGWANGVQRAGRPGSPNVRTEIVSGDIVFRANEPEAVVN
jgi:hypothetical protein